MKYRVFVFAAILFYIAACAPTTPLKERKGFIEITIAVPIEISGVNSDDNGDRKNNKKSQNKKTLYLVNKTNRMVQVCQLAIPSTLAITMSMPALKNCGGAEMIQKEITKKNLIIKPLVKNELIWVITEGPTNE